MSFLISFVLSVINGSTGSNMIPQGILFSLSFFIALNLFDETETFGSIIDANLSLEAINYIFKAYSDKKFLIESISPYKVIKFKEHLKNIYLIKCNLFEARALCDDNSLSAIEACKILLNKGIKKVVVSAASDNIYYGEDNNVNCFKINKVDSFVNTTGCGDALFSGIVDRIIANDTLYNAISLGHKLSLLTLQSEKATTKEVSKYQHD